VEQYINFVVMQHTASSLLNVSHQKVGLGCCLLLGRRSLASILIVYPRVSGMQLCHAVVVYIGRRLCGGGQDYWFGPK
jgi:hypothetical protein